MIGKWGRKRVLGLALGAVATLVIAGAAFAYFTGVSGTGTSSSTVGTAGDWSVTFGTASFSPLGYTSIYPGAGTETIPYTVTNTGKGQQQLQSLVVAMDSTPAGDAEALTAGSLSDISGCLASWFVPVIDHASPNQDIASGGTYTGNITLTMTDAATAQDSCKGSAPALSLTAG